MRITFISSSIASVISLATDTVTVAGIAVRTLLHLMFLREHMGYWLKPCQSSFVYVDGTNCLYIANPQSGNKPELQRLFGMSALAVCPAPSRLASVRSARQG